MLYPKDFAPLFDPKLVEIREALRKDEQFKKDESTVRELLKQKKQEKDKKDKDFFELLDLSAAKSKLAEMRAAHHVLQEQLKRANEDAEDLEKRRLAEKAMQQTQQETSRPVMEQSGNLLEAKKLSEEVTRLVQQLADLNTQIETLVNQWDDQYSAKMAEKIQIRATTAAASIMAVMAPVYTNEIDGFINAVDKNNLKQVEELKMYRAEDVSIANEMKREVLNVLLHLSPPAKLQQQGIVVNERQYIVFGGVMAHIQILDKERNADKRRKEAASRHQHLPEDLTKKVVNRNLRNLLNNVNLAGESINICCTGVHSDHVEVVEMHNSELKALGNSRNECRSQLGAALEKMGHSIPSESLSAEAFNTPFYTGIPKAQPKGAKKKNE